MKHNKPSKYAGFTLVELIIVIAIIAVLSGVLAPQYIRYVEKAKSAKCTEQRNAAIRAFAVECTGNDTFRTSAVGADSQTLADLTASDDCLGTVLTCSDGGVLTYTFSAAANCLDITCDKHQETTIADEVNMRNFAGAFLDAYDRLIAEGKTAKQALDILRADPKYSAYSKNYLNNEDIRKLYYDANDGWVPVTIGGKTYYSKLMANVSASGFQGSSDVIIYANTNAALGASNDWAANYVYYNGYWYQPPAGSGSMAGKTMSQLKAAIDAADSKWTKVDG